MVKTVCVKFERKPPIHAITEDTEYDIQPSEDEWSDLACSKRLRLSKNPSILSCNCETKLAKKLCFGQTRSTDTPSDRETDRVQLASHGSSKLNRCARDFDLGCL
ncbi:hypothetical protein JOB18_043874 [Solea senegalensis]|uniref:Uncharacterized protein n=1 Tax=Solea senegalensis TaxID=28829 RepID=A0AAV6RN72_SOLSE|nr:hypothetical protein JOB18_043874 [Solea senegalensis]